MKNQNFGVGIKYEEIFFKYSFYKWKVVRDKYVIYISIFDIKIILFYWMIVSFWMFFQVIKENVVFFCLQL